jgi:hypothetical protein
MSASLSDIMTVQKNGVTALNQLSRQGAIPVLFGRGAMTASYSVVYTAPVNAGTTQANGKVILTNVDICNTSNTSATIYVSLVSFNGTPGAANALYYAKTIAANDVLQWRGSQVLNPGDTLQAYASTTACTLIASGGLGS